MGGHEMNWSRPVQISWNRGGLSFASDTLHVCAVCHVQTEATFEADGSTHDVERSGEPCNVTVGLCVKCWSRLLKEED